MGGALGETFVADVEDIGSIGDAFEAGPTQLTEVTDEGGKEDAARKLLNRVKLGFDNVRIVTLLIHLVARLGARNKQICLLFACLGGSRTRQRLGLGCLLLRVVLRHLLQFHMQGNQGGKIQEDV